MNNHQQIPPTTQPCGWWCNFFPVPEKNHSHYSKSCYLCNPNHETNSNISYPNHLNNPNLYQPNTNYYFPSSYYPITTMNYPNMYNTTPYYPNQFYPTHPENYYNPENYIYSQHQPTQTQTQNENNDTSYYWDTNEYQQNVEENEENVDEGEGEVEFVLSEEWAARFAATEKKRAERKMERRKEKKGKGVSKERNSEHHKQQKESFSYENVFDPTKLSESEKHLGSRKHQLETLYGKEANSVEQLEISMSSHFDQLCDQYGPSLWPELPINTKILKKKNLSGYEIFGTNRKKDLEKFNISIEILGESKMKIVKLFKLSDTNKLKKLTIKSSKKVGKTKQKLMLERFEKLSEHFDDENGMDIWPGFLHITIGKIPKDEFQKLKQFQYQPNLSIKSLNFIVIKEGIFILKGEKKDYLFARIAYDSETKEFLNDLLSELSNKIENLQIELSKPHITLIKYKKVIESDKDDFNQRIPQNMVLTSSSIVIQQAGSNDESIDQDYDPSRKIEAQWDFVENKFIIQIIKNDMKSKQKKNNNENEKQS